MIIGYDKVSWKFTLIFSVIMTALVSTMWIITPTPVERLPEFASSLEEFSYLFALGVFPVFKWITTISVPIVIIFFIYASAHGLEIWQEDTTYKGEAY